MIFPVALKKRGVGMVVGAPSRCTRLHSCQRRGPAGVRGTRVRRRSLFDSKQAGTVNSNPNGCCRIARFVRLVVSSPQWHHTHVNPGNHGGGGCGRAWVTGPYPRKPPDRQRLNNFIFFYRAHVEADNSRCVAIPHCGDWSCLLQRSFGRWIQRSQKRF